MENCYLTFLSNLDEFYTKQSSYHGTPEQQSLFDVDFVYSFRVSNSPI